MKFIKLVLAAALFQLPTACAPPQNGAQAGADESSETREMIRRAGQGNADAQTALGRAYKVGKGVPKDQTLAVNWFRKAAEQGDADAQLWVAWAYRDGEGVPQDYAQALNWYRKAAEQGVPAAQSALSGAYQLGQGVPQDDAQSVYWLRKLAEQGDAGGQYALSYAFQKGKGVPQDFVLAYAWMNLAATSRQAEFDSARNLAEQTPYGIENLQERDALNSRQESAESHLESARSVRASVAEKLSPSQLAEAQRLSSNWQKGQSIQREKQ